MNRCCVVRFAKNTYQICKLWGACKIQESIKLYILLFLARVFSLLLRCLAITLRLRRGYNFHTELIHQYFRLFDFDAYRYHPSARPCPQAFLPYTEPWWIIDLEFRFFQGWHLSLFTLMKALKKITLPSCISSAGKIVATIETFLKFILQGVINYVSLFSLEAIHAVFIHVIDHLGWAQGCRLGWYR